MYLCSTLHYVGSSVDCSHKGLSAVPPILNNITGKKWYIDLSYNNIISIPDGTLGAISISGLLLQYNKLTSMGDNVFKGNEDTILSLYLHFNNLTEIPTAVGKLTNMFELSVYGNPIRNLNTETLSGMSESLLTFSFGSSSLQSWPHTLTSLARASWFNVYGIPLETLPGDAFSDQLYILNITDSNLKSLSNTLNNKPRFDELDLKNIPNLTTEGLSEGGFKNLTKFRTLSIINCSIDTLPHIFDDLIYLGDVTLTGNPIRDIADDTFPHNFTSMYRLTISDSLLEKIPVAITRMTKLMDLFFTNNRITTIHDTDFHGMTGLYNLHLSGNPLSNISDNAFKSQRELSSLYLDNTFMTTVPKAIKSIRRLYTLNLDNARVECSCESLVWMKDLVHDTKRTPNIVGNCFNTGKPIYDYVINDVPHCQENEI
ncbi:hypothetical protein FSP39_002163 [Pinctada imbricata]|uniref:Uncharacterized protein n=1 Tax=Pinctada imbricata TaxID=66713 RepID=A0AA89BVH8_PINIB|nr:hypothetical protein FSP39_002163 [Pinctada imbricata]